MEWLLARPTVIGLAVIGGVLSVLAMLLRKREGAQEMARQLDIAGYVFMGTSILLFIVVGFRGPQ
jgi:predicted membrane channel-forming protein YqfA (hemolysin III family)